MSELSISQGSVNRVAFPKARIFIYGQEVSSDMLSVRVTHSSGSLERAPSTCAISLVNPHNKYILTNKDIRKIGQLKHKINGTWTDAVKAVQKKARTRSYYSSSDNYITDLVSDPYVDEEGNTVSLVESGNNWDVEVSVAGNDVVRPLGGKSLTQEVINELAVRFSQSSSEEIYQTLQGMTTDSGDPLVATMDDAVSLSKAIEREWKFSNTTVSSPSDLTITLSELDIPYAVKQDVVAKKMRNTLHLIPLETNSNALNYEDKLIYDYPMQEGDCVFHSNDPVRVVMRDPFDPRVWYWMFTGFIDSVTEDQSMNMDSTLTLTCTDVTKMARYATIALDTGILEGEEIPVAELTGASTGANLGLILDSNLFSDLPVPTILETIFFGSESAKKILDASTLSLVGSLEGLTEDELNQYFEDTQGFSLEQMYQKISIGTESSAMNSDVTRVEGSVDWNVVKNKVLSDLTIKKRGKLNELNLPSVSSPRHVRFKRQNEFSGINYYVFGEPDAADLEVGATAIKDLRDWNEVIHHRIRISDLVTMNKEAESDSDDPTETTLDQVIWKIGTDIDSYPVGSGRVFYFAPAALSSVIGLNALDKAFGGAGSVHSSFKDRLSYLYDLAEAIDWRFYSTPKGDLVFEMPFYDYDPDYFWEKEEKVTSSVSDGDKDYYAASDAYRGQTSEDLTLSEVESLGLSYDELDLYSGAFGSAGRSNDSLDPPFNYARAFTVFNHEQSGFSNTNTDNGIVTAYRSSPHIVAGFSGQDSDNAKTKVVVYDYNLLPTLGARVSEGASAWSFVDTVSEAEIFGALQLNKINSNARNLSIEVIPKFGLMSNRPMHWLTRNYYGLIVSTTHHLVWNSDVGTSININNIRAWSGEVDSATEKMVFRHYGDTDRPFNLSLLFNKSSKTQKGSSDELF